MKNISENLRKLGKEHKVVWTTDVENVYIETWTESKTIDLAQAQRELDELNAQIETMPDTTMIEIPSGKDALIKERDDKISYIADITPTE